MIKQIDFFALLVGQSDGNSKSAAGDCSDALTQFRRYHIAAG